MPRPSGRIMRRLWRTMLDRESIVFRTQTTPGVYGNATISDCWWRSGPSGEAEPSRGVYLRDERQWFLPQEKKSVAPNTGDLIVNDASEDFDNQSVTWTILSVNKVGALGCWSCDSLSLQLQANLRDSGTIDRPTNLQDDAGRMALTSYGNVAVGVPCKLQTQGGEAIDVFDRWTMMEPLICYLGYFVDARAKDRLTVSGVKYTILASREPYRIDALQALDVQRIL